MARSTHSAANTASSTLSSSEFGISRHSSALYPCEFFYLCLKLSLESCHFAFFLRKLQLYLTSASTYCTLLALPTTRVLWCAFPELNINSPVKSAFCSKRCKPVCCERSYTTRECWTPVNVGIMLSAREVQTSLYTWALGPHSVAEANHVELKDYFPLP